jgi:hypothetical protein
MATTAIVPSDGDLVPAVSQSADQNPARIYLASLGESSRRTVTHDLGVIAALLTGVDPPRPRRMSGSICSTPSHGPRYGRTK